MREIVVSMQNTLLSEAVARSLAETGEFRVEQVLPGKTGDTFSLCRAAQADILLMEVSRLPAYTLDYNNGQKSSDDLYDRSYLEGKDKYSVFFGGNQPVIRASIKNNSARKLLVIKDSYAHCFLPFTFEDFSEVDFIDIRYFNESLKNYLETSDYTDLLFLYNASGFAEDVSLAKLLS